MISSLAFLSYNIWGLKLGPINISSDFSYRLKFLPKKLAETNADIILGLDTNLLTAAKNTNLLEKHKVQISDLNLPISWSDEFFIPFDWGHFSFVYNSESLKEPPKSFD